MFVAILVHFGFFARLRRFLPPFFPEHLPVALQEGKVVKVGASRVCFVHFVLCVAIKEEGRRLDMSSWLVAWDRYALAATVNEQLTFSEATAHKGVVSEVLALARTGGLPPFLAVLYDEVARCISLYFASVFSFVYRS